MVHSAEHMRPETTFHDIDHEQVIIFLDSKLKPEQIEPDKKWISTWDDYFWRLKLF